MEKCRPHIAAKNMPDKMLEFLKKRYTNATEEYKASHGFRVLIKGLVQFVFIFSV